MLTLVILSIGAVIGIPWIAWHALYRTRYDTDDLERSLYYIVCNGIVFIGFGVMVTGLLAAIELQSSTFAFSDVVDWLVNVIIGGGVLVALDTTYLYVRRTWRRRRLSRQPNDR